MRPVQKATRKSIAVTLRSLADLIERLEDDELSTSPGPSTNQRELRQ